MARVCVILGGTGSLAALAKTSGGNPLCGALAGAAACGWLLPASLAIPPLRRLRPPRLPLRRPFLSGVPSAGVEDGEPFVACCTSLLTATADSNASGFCSNGRPGSATVVGGAVSANSPATGPSFEATFPSAAPPSLAAASCAFFFQSARTNLSPAVLNHFNASAFCPEPSKNFPSSNATIASRVFWKRFESCPAGSLLVRARRIRAVICFQSLIGCPQYNSAVLCRPAFLAASCCTATLSALLPFLD